MDDFELKRVKNLKENLNSSEYSRSILEDFKSLKESIPDKITFSMKKTNKNKNNEKNLFITGGNDHTVLKDMGTSPLQTGTYLNGRKIYYQIPRFSNRRLIVLKPSKKIPKLNFPRIRLNECKLDPNLIEEKFDIYKSWTIRDVKSLEKSVLPRFKS